jgi:aryl-alcohol dehydrogenase-like predicted oxidoreductase
LKKRKLGRSHIEVAPLCFGGNIFGWTVDEPASFSLLDQFVDAGFDFIDTADAYSTWVPGNRGGESETILGKWLKKTGKRSKVIIATKVGMDMGDGKKGLRKNYILQAVEASLQRLQTDYLDLYQSHKDDLETPVEETLEAYATLFQQGKIRAIGASNFTAERLTASLAASRQLNIPRYESLQPLYNLIDRADYETNLEPICIKENVGVITYFSLAAGFLTGKYRSENDLAKYKRGARVQKYLTPRNFKILDSLDAVARRHETTMARVALAWVIARPSVTAPIASATNAEQMNELFAATRLTLDPDSLQELDNASAP